MLFRTMMKLICVISKRKKKLKIIFFCSCTRMNKCLCLCRDGFWNWKCTAERWVVNLFCMCACERACVHACVRFIFSISISIFSLHLLLEYVQLVVVVSVEKSVKKDNMHASFNTKKIYGKGNGNKSMRAHALCSCLLLWWSQLVVVFFVMVPIKWIVITTRQSSPYLIRKKNYSLKVKYLNNYSPSDTRN